MLRFSLSSLRFLTGLVALLALGSGIAIASATDVEPSELQTIHIADTRTGDGACGFEIQHDFDFALEVTPITDGSGTLVLWVQPVSRHGPLTNPSNGTSVELSGGTPE
jgi:hypothetical protein